LRLLANRRHSISISPYVWNRCICSTHENGQSIVLCGKQILKELLANRPLVLVPQTERSVCGTSTSGLFECFKGTLQPCWLVLESDLDVIFPSFLPSFLPFLPSFLPSGSMLDDGSMLQDTRRFCERSASHQVKSRFFALYQQRMAQSTSSSCILTTLYNSQVVY
jgi:hypothetical protein